MSTCRGSRNAMLASSRFRNDTVLSHPHRQQSLAERVIDFVRTGMIQVFAFEPDLGAATVLGKAAGEIQWRGAAYKSSKQRIQLCEKLLIRRHGFDVVSERRFRLGLIHAQLWRRGAGAAE